MNALNRLIKNDPHGLHYAVSMFLATAVLWMLVMETAHVNPVWAISSMVATSDPAIRQAVVILRSRIANALIGCIVGLAVIAVGGPHMISMPLAMAITVLLSWYVVRFPTMWRQAPIGAAFVVAASLQHHTRRGGLVAGAGRMGEVLLGCVVGIIVAWIVSVFWPLPESTPSDQQSAS